MMWLMIAAVLFLILFMPKTAFAKGGSSKTVDAVGAKSANLQNLENSFYAAVNPLISAYSANIPTYTMVSPVTGAAANNTAAVSNGKGKSRSTTADGIPQPYNSNTLSGQLFNNATAQTYAANNRYNDLLAQSPDMLSAAQTAGDEWYGRAAAAADTASSNLQYTNEIDKWYSEYAKDQLSGAQGMMNTGEIPEAIANALRAETDRGLKSSIGSSLASLASRGVLNSSVTNKGLADTAQAAGDAYNRNYLDAFNTALGGYQNNANTAANTGASLTDTFLKMNSEALRQAESMANVGSMRTGDLLNVFNANLAERQSLMNDLGQYYTNAAAPMMPAYDFLQTMLQDHWNSDKKDTIVKSGK
jgi:hypothetical protein